MPVERYDTLTWSDFEDMCCAVCTEGFDYDEINFFPCECGFQICKFCWDRIANSDTPLCPACRKPYENEPYLADGISDQLKEKLEAAKKDAANKSKNPPTDNNNNHACCPDPSDRDLKNNKNWNMNNEKSVCESKKHLANVRVLQKNLVFVMGLSHSMANEETLKKYEHFGRYGPIKKVVISTHNTNYAGSKDTATAAAYLTYANHDDALKAIQGSNGSYVSSRTLKCSLGTTKYCSRYLKDQECTLTDCMYLHDVADPEASFTKVDMTNNKHQEYEQSLMDDFKRRQKQKDERERNNRLARERELKNTKIKKAKTLDNKYLDDSSNPPENPWKRQTSVNDPPNQNFKTMEPDRNINYNLGGHNQIPTAASIAAASTQPPNLAVTNNSFVFPKLGQSQQSMSNTSVSQTQSAGMQTRPDSKQVSIQEQIERDAKLAQQLQNQENQMSQNLANNMMMESPANNHPRENIPQLTNNLDSNFPSVSRTHSMQNNPNMNHNLNQNLNSLAGANLNINISSNTRKSNKNNRSHSQNRNEYEMNQNSSNYDASVYQNQNQNRYPIQPSEIDPAWDQQARNINYRNVEGASSSHPLKQTGKFQQQLVNPVSQPNQLLSNYNYTHENISQPMPINLPTLHNGDFNPNDIDQIEAYRSHMQNKLDYDDLLFEENRLYPTINVENLGNNINNLLNDREDNTCNSRDRGQKLNLKYYGQVENEFEDQLNKIWDSFTDDIDGFIENVERNNTLSNSQRLMNLGAFSKNGMFIENRHRSLFL